MLQFTIAPCDNLMNTWYECLFVPLSDYLCPDWPEQVPAPRVAPVHLLHRRWEQVAVLGGAQDGAAEPQAQLLTPVVEGSDVAPFCRRYYL